VIANWTKELDRARAQLVFAGDLPFDEMTLIDDGHGGPGHAPTAGSGPEKTPAAV
jgi:aerobic C4-dicarboxylate transport protein